MFHIIFITILFFSLNSAYSQNADNKNSSDKTILRTDSVGNILGGDMKYWDFDENNYDEIQEYNYMFGRPFYKGDPIPVTGFQDEPFSFEIDGHDVILKWSTATEIDNKGFYVERKEFNSMSIDKQWMELGFVKGYGSSEKERKYEVIDKDLGNGKYNYRLKQISFNNEFQYHNLNSEVFMINYPSQFEFYPAYPNPVSDKVNISFYLPKKDVVSLFFINGDTTYILDHEPQERGFYKLTIDKNSLGFENEIKRLYIDCKSCNKKRNFGDIQF